MALLRKAHGPELSSGSIIDRYRVEELIAEGGMGAVYRASCQDTGDTVALKVIKGNLAGDEQSQRRFRHEARAASEVSHKHLVPLLDFGEWDGRRYLVMSYVPGRSLDDRLKASGPLSLPDVLQMTGQIASALDALHGAGIIHRDVKAANILFDGNGSAQLTDFGLAKGTNFSALTRPGTIVGSLDYLAPERIRGAAADASTDIYSLGVVVYEALSGQTPFGGKGMFELAGAILGEDPPELTELRNDLPPQLSEAVLMALAKDPARRPPTAVTYANVLTVAARSA